MENLPKMTVAKYDDIFALNKCIFGLGHTGKMYHTNAAKVLSKIGCKLWWKWPMCVLFVALNMDKNLIVGNPEEIEKPLNIFKGWAFCQSGGFDRLFVMQKQIQFSENKNMARTTSLIVAWQTEKTSLGTKFNIWE